MATWIAEESLDKVIGTEEMKKLLVKGLQASGRDLSKLAVVATDKTRKPGKAGELTEALYKETLDSSNNMNIANIFLALGSHTMHTEQENTEMFGSIPNKLFLGHDWINGVTKIGVVPDSVVQEFSGGIASKWHNEIPVQVNTKFYEGLKQGRYTTAVSIGPVFPHEVVGFSNGFKNIFVGLGGKGYVDYTHILGAVYGMEKMMGRLETPVRKVFNYSNEHFLKDFGIIYVLTVLDKDQNVRGFYVGDDIETHAKAAALSKKLNVDIVDEPLNKVVVYLDPKEFTSFWLCNKAIYRTRMGMADDGELIAIAPGLKSFADDPQKNPVMEELIETYGYKGTEHIVDALKRDPKLAANLSVAAHLIHGSPEERFKVTYATDPSLMPAHRVKRVGFDWMDSELAIEQYNPKSRTIGMNILNEVPFFYIPNPSIVLLSTKERMEG